MLRRSALPLLTLLISGPAAAQDLSTALEVWSFTESGEDGNDMHDEAHGIAIDSLGNYVAVGSQDGVAGNGKNAFARKYDNVGTLVWETIDDRGPLDAYKTEADDMFWDVEVDDADQVCLVGQVSGDATLGWDSGYYIAKLNDYDGLVAWDDTWRDGGASTVQAGRGVAIDPNQDVAVTGWSFRSATQSGQWASFRYITTTGLRDLGPVYYDYGADFDAPDQAFDIAVDSAGDIIVVGAIGNDGATGASDSNRDWHVRKFAGASSTTTGTTAVNAGDLLWEHTWTGTAGLDDVAMGVAIDSNDEIFVVGYTNLGTDNDANADYDWLVIKYDSTGGAGFGNPLFEATWSDPTNPGAKEMLTDVHISDNGFDLIVGGTWDDGGNAAWRVAALAGFNGYETSAWAWPAANGGDSYLHSIDVRDGRVVAAGSVWNGSDRDIQYTLLDQDTDGDYVGDSVDGCPFDGTKTEPGECGCGNPDVDSDYDTFLDCDDACPDLAEKWKDEGVCGCDEPDADRDGDGTEDCIDNCPDDPLKDKLGECGCGVPDDDSDGDGVLGCDDACSQTPIGTEVDEDGCPPEDCTNGIDDNNNTKLDCADDQCIGHPECASGAGGDDDGKGCGCSASPGAPTGLLALGLAALAVRRRSR